MSDSIEVRHPDHDLSSGGTRTATQEPGKDATADELEVDIEITRERLGQTVDALTQKLDFKSRGREKVSAIKRRAGDQLGAARSEGTALAGRVGDAAHDDQGQIKIEVYLAAIAVAAFIGASLVGKASR